MCSSWPLCFLYPYEGKGEENEWHGDATQSALCWYRNETIKWEYRLIDLELKSVPVRLRVRGCWLVGFLTSSSTTRLYRGRAPRQSVNFTCCHTWDRAGRPCLSCHIILTPTQPVGSERPQRESNLGAPHQESRALPTELPRPPPPPPPPPLEVALSFLSTL